jgi:diadenosine tetraphosphatase ApaH/serine/threonine PP2A family protein phosphatase
VIAKLKFGDKPVCPLIELTGHSHVPELLYARQTRAKRKFEISSIMVEPFRAYNLDADIMVINPGSVGQPRDLDQRAAYAILDLGNMTRNPTITFYKVTYDVPSVTREINQSIRNLSFFSGRLPPHNIVNNLQLRMKAKLPKDDVEPAWKSHFERVKMIEE